MDEFFRAVAQLNLNPSACAADMAHMAKKVLDAAKAFPYPFVGWTHSGQLEQAVKAWSAYATALTDKDKSPSTPSIRPPADAFTTIFQACTDATEADRIERIHGVERATKYLTVRQIADKYDADSGTVRKWCKLKGCRHGCKREGKEWRIPESAVSHLPWKTRTRTMKYGRRTFAHD